MIGAVVPTYNRRDNLETLFMSLAAQTVDDFAVVVADDGSSDGIREFIEDLALSNTWRDRLRWVGCGPHLGVRTGRARNIGAANLPGGAELLVMLDTDLVLRPEAMSLFRGAHQRHPRAVLFGTVEWLPPLERTAVLDALRRREPATLKTQVPRTQPIRAQGTFTGPELRDTLFRCPSDTPIPLRPEWALPLNSGWPLATYWQIGGFDESIGGYGYQDMDMGVRAAKAGLTCVACPDIWALHVWHPKPAQAMVENQRNLDRYLRTHGEFLRRHTPDDVLEVDVDWRLWWHYHAERGGAVTRSGNQIYAVNRSRRDRLALPDASWLADLGHAPNEFSDVPAAELDRMLDHGTAN
jgi:validoxylamine A glucosyltransferase